jgi:hypothetical protein
MPARRFRGHETARDQAWAAVTTCVLKRRPYWFADTIGVQIAVSAQVAQLVEAMAGFGGGSGADDGLNIVPLDVEGSRQSFLTTPQHS